MQRSHEMMLAIVIFQITVSRALPPNAHWGSAPGPRWRPLVLPPAMISKPANGAGPVVGAGNKLLVLLVRNESIDLLLLYGSPKAGFHSQKFFLKNIIHAVNCLK